MQSLKKRRPHSTHRFHKYALTNLASPQSEVCKSKFMPYGPGSEMGRAASQKLGNKDLGS